MKLPPPFKLRRNTMQQPYAGSQKQRYVYNQREWDSVMTDIAREPSSNVVAYGDGENEISQGLKSGFQVILAEEMRLGGNLYIPNACSGITILSLGAPLTLRSGVSYAFDCAANNVKFRNIVVSGGELVTRTENSGASQALFNCVVDDCILDSWTNATNWYGLRLLNSTINGNATIKIGHSFVDKLQVGGTFTVEQYNSFYGTLLCGTLSKIYVSGTSTIDKGVYTGNIFRDDVTWGSGQVVFTGNQVNGDLDAASKPGVIDGNYISGALNNTGSATVGDNA